MISHDKNIFIVMIIGLYKNNYASVRMSDSAKRLLQVLNVKTVIYIHNIIEDKEEC